MHLCITDQKYSDIDHKACDLFCFCQAIWETCEDDTTVYLVYTFFQMKTKQTQQQSMWNRLAWPAVPSICIEVNLRTLRLFLISLYRKNILQLFHFVLR